MQVEMMNFTNRQAKKIERVPLPVVEEALGRLMKLLE